VIWWGADRDRDHSLARISKILDVMRRIPDGLGWWVIVERDSDELIGTVALDFTPVPEGSVEIGWHLRRDRWGLGYATEAAVTVRDHGFGNVGLLRIVATIVPENHRSVRVAERIGMVRVPPDVRRAGMVHGVWAVEAPAALSSGGAGNCS
jgi:RimJ/RimL family protein N-acetyltransferase